MMSGRDTATLYMYALRIDIRGPRGDSNTEARSLTTRSFLEARDSAEVVVKLSHWDDVPDLDAEGNER